IRAIVPAHPAVRRVGSASWRRIVSLSGTASSSATTGCSGASSAGASTGGAGSTSGAGLAIGTGAGLAIGAGAGRAIGGAGDATAPPGWTRVPQCAAGACGGAVATDARAGEGTEMDNDEDPA